MIPRSWHSSKAYHNYLTSVSPNAGTLTMNINRLSIPSTPKSILLSISRELRRSIGIDSRHYTRLTFNSKPNHKENTNMLISVVRVESEYSKAYFLHLSPHFAHSSILFQLLQLSFAHTPQHFENHLLRNTPTYNGKHHCHRYFAQKRWRRGWGESTRQ